MMRVSILWNSENVGGRAQPVLYQGVVEIVVQVGGIKALCRAGGPMYVYVVHHILIEWHSEVFES